MADSGKKPATHKAARALPLTHRQQRATKRPRSEHVALPTAPHRRASITPQRKQPLAPATTTAPLAVSPELEPLETLETLEPAPVEALPDAPPTSASATEAGAERESIWLADTTLLQEPHAAAPSTSAEAPATSETPDAPRRMRVRVRRKRPAAAAAAPVEIAPPDITRVDTAILPSIRIVAPGEAEPSLSPASMLPLIAVDGIPVNATPAEAPSITDAPATAPAPAEEPPAEVAGEVASDEVADVETPPVDVVDVEAPLVDVADAEAPIEAAPEIAVADEVAPQASEEPAYAAEPEPTLAAEIAEPEAPEAAGTDSSAALGTPEEPARSAPPRRMPTLAVMAALTQRSEPAAPPAPDAAEDAPPRAARPTVPEPETDRLDFSMQETEALAAPAFDVPAQDTVALEPPAPPIAEPPAEPLAEAFTAQVPKDEASAASSDHRMWWPQAARRRAAPETRPIPVAPAMPADEDPDITAPRPIVRRAQSTQPTSAAQPTWSVASTAASSAAPTARSTAAREAAPASEDAPVLRRRASSRQKRAEAKRSGRVAVLSWAAFGHAAVAMVAALIAVIAALRGPAASDDLVVFGWAVTLALIAGVGAALGYTCAQLGLPRLATLTLLLSQLGALAWALGLLGPRAALLALAPASAALALRGAGRLSAVAAGLAWLILFIGDEALTLTGALTPTLPLGVAGAALVDVALTLVGLWLVVNILISLYTSRMNAVAHGRAVEHVALLTEEQLHQQRMRTEDDAEALRRALAEALRGEQPARVYAHGALSAVGEMVNEMADRLIDLRYDRAERKRLESATRRLTRVIERAWLGLSWSWPEATGTILDDLLALLRTPPPPDAPDLLDENAPTGQVVAPHLFRGWRPTESGYQFQRPQSEALPGMPSVPSQPSAPTLPSLWPRDAGVRLTNPLELPPSPRWRSPDASRNTTDETGATER